MTTNNRAKSNRKNDMQQERIISDFLMKNYFTKKNESARLINEEALQFAGVDVRMENKLGQTLNIDIKAQASAKYINNPTDTFVLELAFLDRAGNPFVGWFLNEKIITDYYTFVWVIDSNVDEKKQLHSADDIKKVEIMTVDKKKLTDYIMPLLKENNYEATIATMRNTEETYQSLARGVHYIHTPFLNEKPVNLVVKKDILKRFACAHDIVSQKGIAAVK